MKNTLQQTWIKMMLESLEAERWIFNIPEDIGRFVKGLVYEMEWVDHSGETRWRSPVIFDGYCAGLLYFVFLSKDDLMAPIMHADEDKRFGINVKKGHELDLGAISKIRLVVYDGLQNLLTS